MASTQGDSVDASFAGFLNQTEVSKAYVAADCLVLPSDYRETWGLVVNEGMASGLTCVVSDACGCAEDLVAPLSSSLRFRLGDHASLVNALSWVMRHPLPLVTLQRQIDKFDLSSCVATVKELGGHFSKFRSQRITAVPDRKIFGYRNFLR